MDRLIDWCEQKQIDRYIDREIWTDWDRSIVWSIDRLIKINAKNFSKQ